MNISDLACDPTLMIRRVREAMLTSLSLFTDRLCIRRLVASSCFGLSFFCFGTATAAEANAVDVRIPEAPPPARVVAIEYNPIALAINRISFNVELAPAEHHALVLSPYYFYPATPTFTNGAGLTVLGQKFEGLGGELGYRYYFGRGGLRGWFAGPSILAAWVESTAGDGAKTSFEDVGVAADVGYQALVVDDWVVSLGAGAQFVWTTRSIPDQQMPANIYANRGVQPRVLFALGYAF